MSAEAICTAFVVVGMVIIIGPAVWVIARKA